MDGVFRLGRHDILDTVYHPKRDAASKFLLFDRFSPIFDKIVPR